MPVDVQTQTEINRPREQVAANAGDPSNVPRWYVNIKSVEWETPLVPGRRLVMRTAEGPFPMETTYTWDAMGEDRTRMTLRNRGQPSGFSRVAAPFMAASRRRANQKDPAHLKALLERG